MSDFDPAKDRLRQARQAATLARLRAVEPGEADRRAAAATGEPDPTRVHLGILKRNFPALRFLFRPWGRPGLPDLQDVANLATLRAHFSGGKIQPASGQAAVAQHAEAFAAFTKRFGRRSPWSRLAFWRR